MRSKYDRALDIAEDVLQEMNFEDWTSEKLYYELEQMGVEWNEKTQQWVFVDIFDSEDDN
jgi:hypothetical protein